MRRSAAAAPPTRWYHRCWKTQSGLKPTILHAGRRNEARSCRLLERGDVEAAFAGAVRRSPRWPAITAGSRSAACRRMEKMTKAKGLWPILPSPLRTQDYAIKDPPTAVVKAVSDHQAATQVRARAPRPRPARHAETKPPISTPRTPPLRKLWDEITTATMEPQDVATFKTGADLQGDRGRSGAMFGQPLRAAPYEQATRQP